MTDKIRVEFVGGPADGQHRDVLPGPDGIPAAWLDVAEPDRFLGPLHGLDDVVLSVLADRPAGPAPLHRYELEPAADRWRYRHCGPAA